MQGNIDTGVDPRSYFTSNKQWNYQRNPITESKFNQSKTSESEPKMIGYFSVNEYREFVPDASQLRYLKMPSTLDVEFDLNIGIEQFRPKPESVKQEKMDFLLRFIVNNVDKLKVESGYRSNKKLLKPDIICSRGRLVQIMCPHYKSSENKWSLLVSKYKGNIYISQPDGTDVHSKQTAYGFKFEQYLLTGTFAL